MNNPTPKGSEIRTYKLRRSRVTSLQANSIAEFGAQYLYELGPNKIDLAQEIGAEHFVIEIGFGMGEATWQYAELQPEVAVLAIDLHTPGVGKLINELQIRNLKNVRIVEGDALEVIHSSIAQKSVDGIRLFFPDPWPKKRHFKRRFVNQENLAALAKVVRPNGFFHFATDWQDYADWTREELAQSPHWEIATDLSLGIWSNRPTTRFETKGKNLGREITDIVAFRR